MIGISTGLFCQQASFSPFALFSAGEQGFIYDPSDFSTLFQDNAGTTPVTAVGQTVGLVLDKSRGLVLGPELVTNGDFSSATGWTLVQGNGSAIISGGVLTLSGGSTAYPNANQTILTPGRFYRIVVVLASTVPSGSVALRVGGGTVQYDKFTLPGTYTFTVLADGTDIRIFRNSAFTDTAVIDNISVRELPGNHATQSVLASRPILQQDANGKFFLLFDGSDDFLVTPTITPGTDKAQVFAGVRKLSDAAPGSLMNMATSTDNGSMEFLAPLTAGTYRFASRGTVEAFALATGFAAPTTSVLAGISSISADSVIVRVNGTQAASSTTDQGTGNYLAYPAYIGRRGGTSIPFNGRLYGLCVRFGANLDDVAIAKMEAWLNYRTGAY